VTTGTTDLVIAAARIERLREAHAMHCGGALTMASRCREQPASIGSETSSLHGEIALREKQPPAHIRPRMERGSGARLLVGDHVGPYRVVGHLVGNTYRAVHVESTRRALLEVGAAESWREVSLQMLQAQRLVESLRHPGIARIVERGMLADRRPWIATEVPSGIGLYELIARREMPANELVALVRDAADVLGYAHELGVVHRALTLRSILLATGTRGFPVVIADWGLRSGDIGVYAAPEISMEPHTPTDGRVDVYSLGVIAFRAATGRFPGDGGVYDVSGVPSGLATLVARMLAIDPNERPTAAEVRALANYVMANGNVDDVVHVTGPRFAKPKWTPSPDVPIALDDDETAPLAKKT
jgi:serine/threonine protein kinase